jgi:hypothetical protein
MFPKFDYNVYFFLMLIGLFTVTWLGVRLGF